MTIRNLDAIFDPKAVAVIGASTRPGSVGRMVMRNLLDGGFAGPIMPVNPRYNSVEGVLAYRTIADLPVTPDLALICTPPEQVPEMVRQAGQRGVRAAVLIGAGLGRTYTAGGASLAQAAVEAARPTGLRLVGPNTLGLVVPKVGLNASFAPARVPRGRIAFLTQSGAIGTAVMDHAVAHGIGFSAMISLGDCRDVGFADVIDYLAGDPATRAILLYVEAIDSARRFLSAARAAARNKPVLAIKSGRVPAGARAAFTHSGAATGEDEVYEAALRRAGILRVGEIGELFDAVETLHRLQPPRGDRLAILSNGGGPGVMAVDSLIAAGGSLAELAPETVAKLDGVLPGVWSGGNPVDIGGDSDAGRYAEALDILLEDKGADAVLVLHAPTGVADGADVARVVTKAAERTRRPILTSWLGGQGAAPARRVLNEAGIATYDTPHHAVRGFMHRVGYRRIQDMLMETPSSVPETFTPDVAAARAVIAGARAEGRSRLTEIEAGRILGAYGIATIETRFAADAEAAVAAAAALGFPAVLKVASSGITHKSEVGGVVVDLQNADEVRGAAASLAERLRTRAPGAPLDGFLVQRMIRRPRAHELRIAVIHDPVFGPVISFGQGGTAEELVDDRALALPPLNTVLARELMMRTRVHKLLLGYRDRPAADLDEISGVLIRVAQMVVDLPEMRGLDVNPLIADDMGVLVLDAHVEVFPGGGARNPLAIRPYPLDLVETVTMADGRHAVLRPIRPEDEPGHQDFVRHLTPEDIRYRFFGVVREFSHTEMARFTQIDYDREMAFIARTRFDGGDIPPVKPGVLPDETGAETVGVVRVVFDPDAVDAEFAVVVRSDLKGRGLGIRLMNKVIAYCRARGIHRIVGQVLRDNRPMRKLMVTLGFTVRDSLEDDVVEVVLDLRKTAESPAPPVSR
ncbi:bifunctional acetate--CoA ligase family protein/GNAT family N-acetyltransferase [Tistrella mobilis]|uniref:bifunctional acetate--CoA ligase family protein/GNAT family N-acetyltransferase n=1 Tax=Tistrella mobilis TaxID=171437 RepID=UPI0035580B07